MKKIVLIALGALVLAGCGNITGDINKGEIGVKTVEIDGKPVNCVVWDSNRAGGLDCDFK